MLIVDNYSYKALYSPIIALPYNNVDRYLGGSRILRNLDS
jgi:hypothetical protein